jgi:small subunit ribosomal protein S1
MDPNDVIQEPAAEAGDADLETFLQEGYGFTPLKRGEVREGTIVSISSSAILIDLGSKTEGVVAGRELERMPREMLNNMKVGDEVLSYVVNPEDKNGNIVLSLTRAQLEKDWREAERLYKTQEMFSGSVAGFNKGGLIVRLGKVRGFVPASQLASSRHVRSGKEGSTPEEKWGNLVGEMLQLKVIEIDRERNRLILSERAAMREWRRAQKEKLLAELTEGEIREGKVISIADFGAFVDLGGADGLIHLSELSWKRVNHPREVLSVGDKVKVYILNVDRDRRRIGLSLKRLQPDPWTLVDDNYQVDQLVEGVITKLAKFGAFACIVGDEEIEGLIHISELSDGHIAHPKEVVEEGQVVTLRIIRIDSDQRRMGLSLKRVDQAEYADLDWQAELVTSQEEASEIHEGDHQIEALAPSSAEAELPVEALAPGPAEAELPVEALTPGPAEAELPIEALTPGPAEVELPIEALTPGPAEVELPIEALTPGPAEAELPVEVLTPGPAEAELPVEALTPGPAEAELPVEALTPGPAEAAHDKALPEEAPGKDIDEQEDDTVAEAAVEVVAE